jgi:hypothetical protein
LEFTLSQQVRIHLLKRRVVARELVVDSRAGAASTRRWCRHHVAKAALQTLLAICRPGPFTSSCRLRTRIWRADSAAVSVPPAPAREPGERGRRCLRLQIAQLALGANHI